MTKKDFIAIAAALRQAKPIAYGSADLTHGWLAAVNAIANHCAQSNPRFDRAKFLIACGAPIN